jgi:hypothetical protein
VNVSSKTGAVGANVLTFITYLTISQKLRDQYVMVEDYVNFGKTIWSTSQQMEASTLEIASSTALPPKLHHMQQPLMPSHETVLDLPDTKQLMCTGWVSENLLMGMQQLSSRPWASNKVLSK